MLISSKARFPLKAEFTRRLSSQSVCDSLSISESELVSPAQMLNHQALRLLAAPSTLPSTLLHPAILFLADHDLSLPRLLNPSLLDSRYSWRAGTASKILSRLLSAGLLSRLTTSPADHSTAPASTPAYYRLHSLYCWTPAALADQWELMERSQGRRAVVLEERH